MDDITLHGINDSQPDGLLNTLKLVYDGIKMEFVSDKCAKATFKRGKRVCTEGIQLPDTSVIQELEPEATYIYLFIEKGNRTEHHKMKVKIQKEYEKNQTDIQV